MYTAKMTGGAPGGDAHSPAMPKLESADSQCLSDSQDSWSTLSDSLPIMITFVPEIIH